MEIELPATALMTLILAVAAATSSKSDEPTKTDYLHATLKAGAQVPGPGKKGASGSVRIEFRPPRIVCYFVHYDNVPDASDAHVHKGKLQSAGPAVITMRNIDRGDIHGCEPVTHAFMYQLWNHPRDYYVDIHDKAFPNGAVRGQLHH